MLSWRSGRCNQGFFLKGRPDTRGSSGGSWTRAMQSRLVVGSGGGMMCSCHITGMVNVNFFNCLPLKVVKLYQNTVLHLKFQSIVLSVGSRSASIVQKQTIIRTKRKSNKIRLLPYLPHDGGRGVQTSSLHNFYYITVRYLTDFFFTISLTIYTSHTITSIMSIVHLLE